MHYGFELYSNYFQNEHNYRQVGRLVVKFFWHAIRGNEIWVMWFQKEAYKEAELDLWHEKHLND